MPFSGPILGASRSSKPVGAPSWVARRRSSGVAPLASAASRASPAPAATPIPAAAARPASPSGPSAKNGIVDPIPSNNRRGIDSSYPGAAANGALATPAISLIFSRAAFSVSSGNNALIPVAAVSARPTRPGIGALKISFTWPRTVVFGGASCICVSAVRAALNLACTSAASCCRIYRWVACIRSCWEAPAGPSIS